MRTLCLLSLAGVAAIFCGCAGLPDTSTVQTPLGRHACAQAGGGVPTVVFEAGAGDGLETWAEVYPEVAKFTTAFAYSRRGYGASAPMIAHRDGATIVAELRALLAARNLKPPYVLVGHSLGGLYLQLFAKLHPGEVAGVVLVDSTVAHQMTRMKQERPGNYALLQTMVTVNALKTISAELRGLTETAQQWDAAGSFPRCPMILLSANRITPIDGAGFLAFMHQLHTELLATWPGAEQRLVDSTHYIQRERPEAVVAAIREVVDRARTGPPSSILGTVIPPGKTR
jgi:pimeloyl-ACP methyl ester carboxylesterase